MADSPVKIGAGMPATPELQRLEKVKDESQAAGEFLAWLQEQGFSLCRFDEEAECFYPSYEPIERLLASWLEIDLNKVEAEKRAILEYVRSLSQ
jgi:hypothetical protein